MKRNIIDIKKSALKTILSSTNVSHKQAMTAFALYKKLDEIAAKNEFNLYYVRHCCKLNVVPEFREVI